MTIRLRGHHIAAIDRVRKLTRQELCEELVAQNYVDSPEHPFINYVLKMIQRFSSRPDRLVKIIAGEKDFVCHACPRQASCESMHPKKSPFYGSVFAKGDFITKHSDTETAQKYGFRIGDIVPVEAVISRFRH